MNKELVKKYREYYAARFLYTPYTPAANDPGEPPEKLKQIFDNGRYLQPSHLSFDVAKELYIDCAESICEGLIIDQNNETTIDLIVQYLIRNDKFLEASKHNSFDKGIMLRGAVGTGKTVLMKAMIKFLQYFNVDRTERLNNNEYDLHFSTAYNIAGRYSIKGLQVFEDNPHILYRPIIIDDVGTEPQVAYFGNQANVIAELLYRRYDRKVITHITTNLSAVALKKCYGERIFSRMKEMFNDIILPGNDRRK